MKKTKEKSKNSILRKYTQILFLLLMFLCDTAFAQQQTATGIVKTINGEPIIGVTVISTDGKKGTATDLDGKFSIVIPANAKLKFSSIGYTTVVLAPSANMVVILNEDTKVLNEVVSIGYGTIKKRDITGSVVSIKGAEVVASPTNNAMEALQGKVSGLDVMRPTGEVGGTVDVTLRGIRSLYGGNDPLFIVDGLPSSYDQINPQDIESIDILKDASSTAIYGSAGANGVVIITTKRGAEGKTQINLDTYYGFSGQAYFNHGMTGDEFINYKREGYRTTHTETYPENLNQMFTDADVELINQGKWIDWIDEIIGKPVQQQKYNLSVSSGTAKTKVFTSFNVALNEGMLSNENQQRYGIRLNLDQELAKWAKLGTSVNVNYTNLNARGSNIFTRAISAYPLGEPYTADGEINPTFHNEDLSPLGDQISQQYVNNRKSIYANTAVFIELHPIKALTFRSNFGATLSGTRRGAYTGAKATSNSQTGLTTPSAGIYNNFGFGYQWDNILTFDKTFANDHHVTLTGITSWEFGLNENNSALNQGQMLDSNSFYNLASGTTVQRVTSGVTQNQRMSYAGRIIYAYKGKYMASLTNRWDGVSALAEGHKWDYFPAAALAWRVSDEKFMQFAAKYLSNLKLRYGWGISGNAGSVDPYQSTTGVTTAQRLTIGGSTAASTLYSGYYQNEFLTWEKSYNSNIGIDLGLFNNRIDMSVELYNTDTRNLLCKVRLPITSGATASGDGLQQWQNVGETNNKGFEITLNTVNIKSKDFEWSSSLTFTRNQQKVLKLPSGDIIEDNKILRVGSPAFSWYNYKYLGIWGTEEVELAKQYGANAGFIKIETNPKYDATGVSDNGIHTYQASDLKILGSQFPTWLMGFNNTIKYKGFDLSAFAMVRWGQMIYSNLLGWYDLKSANQPSGTNYWTPENQSGYYPRPGLSNTMFGFSSLRYVDGSYVKIKNVTLGYTVPKSILNKIHMTNVRVYCTAYNPLIFTKEKMLKGTDPENGGNDVFPLYKTYVVGANITF